MSVTVTPLQTAPLRVTPLRVAIAPAPSDHSLLTGLSDDDHPQYHTNARADVRYAALAHGHVITDITPVVPTADYAFNIPLVDPVAVEPVAPIFGFSGNSGVFNNAAVGLNPYRDHTAFLGYNFKDGGVQDDTALPSFGLGWESKFTQSGGTVFAHEFYLRCLKTDGTEFRPFGGYIPYNGVTNNFGFACDYFYLSRDDRTPALDFKFDIGSLFVYGGHKWVHTQNGTPIATQRNAAGTVDHPLPYINASDKLQLPNVKVSLQPPAGAAGVAAFDMAVQGAPANGALGLSISFGAAVNATVESLRSWGSTNWELKSSFYNSHATGTSALEILSGGGPAYLRCGKNGGQYWIAGKNSADNFEIAAITVNGENIALTIDKTTRQVSFNAAPKLPSFTVAGLPSAVTAGAGAQVFVTNESGGAVPAFSDGTNWRRVTDRAVVT